MTFPFLRLPFIVRNEVIRSLCHKDCINLSLSSERAAETVRMARIKTSFAVIELSPLAHILLWPWEVLLFPNNEWRKFKEAGVMKSEESEKWTDKSSNNIVRKTARVYNQVKDIFRFEEEFTLLFSSDYKKVTTVKEVLSDPTLKNWGDCYFDGETIELEELNMIMDMASPERSFTSKVKELPIDFRHENAFKFRSCEYKGARWVKIEDLYELKNVHQVVLERTNFTHSEIKEFISYWVNSEIDMFWCMKIGKAEAFILDEILDGLTLLHIEHWRTCLTMAPSSKTRKRRLLCFTNTGSCLIMSAWAPGEFKSDGSEDLDTAIRKKEGVLELLVEKKQLEMEKESANKENKRKISERLKQLNYDIKDYGVFFVDGKATLRVPMQ